MSSVVDATVRKFHASLNVSDLERSTAFYKTLFGKEAAKVRADYVKFELEDPAVVLSLIPSKGVAGGTLNHAGLRVANGEELVEIQRRMEAVGFATRREDGVECCYALQTKFWITDPDGTLWEVYVFHEDVEERGHGPAKADEAGTNQAAFAKDVARQRIRWEHRIPAAFPEAIELADNSADEIHLEGTINAVAARAGLSGLLKDALRALRPGGSIHVHGLAGDKRLTVDLPPLPGPAAVVEHVPAALEAMQALRDAGFTSVTFEKLSQQAYFRVGGVGLREVLLSGRKPGYRPKKQSHTAVYLGPLAEVKDDFGNVFPRGERVALNIQDWQVLSKSAVAAQFQFFTEEALTVVEETCCHQAEAV